MDLKGDDGMNRGRGKIFCCQGGNALITQGKKSRLPVRGYVMEREEDLTWVFVCSMVCRWQSLTQYFLEALSLKLS